MFVFESTNYLPWLKGALDGLIEENPSLSINKIASQIGVSQSYLSLILSSKRPLSEAAAKKLSGLLNLSEVEEKYLLMLLRKDNTKDTKLRSYLEFELNRFKKSHKVEETELQNFKLISEWYFSAILEVIQLSSIPLTYDYIANRLRLPRKTIEDSMATLKSMGLIKGSEGSFKRTDPGILSTPTELTDMGLRKFHTQMFKKAAEAIQTQKVSDRHFSGTTFAINADLLPLAKKKIEDFKREMIELLEVEPKDAVYQLSVQLFRLDEGT